MTKVTVPATYSVARFHGRGEFYSGVRAGSLVHVMVTRYSTGAEHLSVAAFRYGFPARECGPWLSVPDPSVLGSAV